MQNMDEHNATNIKEGEVIQCRSERFYWHDLVGYVNLAAT